LVGVTRDFGCSLLAAFVWSSFFFDGMKARTSQCKPVTDETAYNFALSAAWNFAFACNTQDGPNDSTSNSNPRCYLVLIH
jgi:hypothetical protein